MPVRRQPPTNIAEAYEGMRQDYAAAKMTRFRRVRTGMLTTVGTGGDYHYRIQADFLRMMEYARDMDRNDAVIGQGVDRAVLNMIQEGLTVDPQTGDAALDADLRGWFNEWAEDPDQCDIEGEHDFGQLQFFALRACLVDGDIFALPTLDGALQLNEAHRCRTPGGTKRNVVHGVLLDDQRKRLEYWFTKQEVDPFDQVKLVSDTVPIAARDSDGFRQVFHVYNPKRISQTRGVTAFAPVFDTAGMFEDINFAAVVRQQISNCFALIRERGIAFKAPNQTPIGLVRNETMSDGTVRPLQGVGPGMEIAGAVGETLKMDGSKVPSMEYFEHVKLMLTLIGINIGMPLVLMLMDASETNFSGWRGALDQAKMGFKFNQKWLSRKLCRPTYIWKTRQRIAQDPGTRRAFERLQAKIFAHRWNLPRWPYIQPLQDAQADALRIEKRLTSPRRLAAGHGIEHASLVAEIVEDNKLAIMKSIEAANDIQEQTGIKVDWHELLLINTQTPAKAPTDPNAAAGAQQPGDPASNPAAPSTPQKPDDEKDSDNPADPLDEEDD